MGLKLEAMQAALENKLLIDEAAIKKLPNNLNSLLPEYKLKKLGGGITKKVFRVNDQPWVVSAVSTEKLRVIQEEVAQLQSFKKLKMRIPGMADDPLFPVKVLSGDGKTTFDGQAFVTEFLDSILVPGKVKKNGFLDLVKSLKANKQKMLEDLGHIAACLETMQEKGEQMYDFQVLIEKTTGEVHIFDPGDPKNSQNVDYLPVVQGWIVSLLNWR